MSRYVTLAPDTKVVLHGGGLKEVGKLVAGDLLMSDLSAKLPVTSLTRDHGQGFTITPVKGIPFTIGYHTKLRLVCNSGQSAGFDKDGVYELSVPTLKQQTKTAIHTLKCFRSAVDFEEAAPLPIDPYFLGIWLGDGSSANLTITNQDSEIENYLKEFALQGNWTIRDAVNAHQTCPHWFFSHRDNPALADKFRELNLFKNKHIPEIYLTSSRENRLKLLAGLLDTDGYLHHGHVEIAVKSNELANNILLLAKSLGFFVAMYTKWVQLAGWVEARPYNRITMSGDLELVPNKLQRRVCGTRKQIKNVLRTGFKVTDTVIDLVTIELEGTGDILTEDFINIATT